MTKSKKSDHNDLRGKDITIAQLKKFQVVSVLWRSPFEEDECSIHESYDLRPEYSCTVGFVTGLNPDYSIAISGTIGLVGQYSRNTLIIPVQCIDSIVLLMDDHIVEALNRFSK